MYSEEQYSVRYIYISSTRSNLEVVEGKRVHLPDPLRYNDAEHVGGLTVVGLEEEDVGGSEVEPTISGIEATEDLEGSVV